jgi:hypothetical protein
MSPGGLRVQNISPNISHGAFASFGIHLLQWVWAIDGSAFQADDAGSITGTRFLF